MALAANYENFLKTLKTHDDDPCSNLDIQTINLPIEELTQQPVTSLDDVAETNIGEKIHKKDNHQTKDNESIIGPNPEDFAERNAYNSHQGNPIINVNKPNPLNTAINPNRHTTRSFSMALRGEEHSVSPPPCFCLSPNPLVALEIPHQSFPNYGSLANCLKKFGTVKALNFDIKSRKYTAIFMCGCQSAAAKKGLLYKCSPISDPFIPTQVVEAEYIPKTDQNTTPLKKTGSATLPKYYYLAAKDDASIYNVRPFLEEAVGDIKKENLTRLGRGFLLKAATEAQAFMIPHIDFNNSDIIKAEPHRSFNSSKGVIKSKELYNAKDDIIKRYADLEITNINRIGKSGMVVVLSFPTSDLPTTLKIHDTILKIEQYEERPQQCKKCFSYLHSTRFCQYRSLCVRCSHPADQHLEGEDCSKPACCALCKGRHNSDDQSCPVYKKEKTILNESRKLGISRGQYRAQQKNVMSQPTSTVQINTIPPKINNTQANNEPPTTKEKNLIWKPANKKKTKKQKNKNSDGGPNNEEPTFELPDLFSPVTGTSEVCFITETKNIHSNQNTTPVINKPVLSPIKKDNQESCKSSRVEGFFVRDLNPNKPAVHREVLPQESNYSADHVNLHTISEAEKPFLPEHQRECNLTTHDMEAQRILKPTSPKGGKKTPPKRGNLNCAPCRIKFKSTSCLSEHKASFHSTKKTQPPKIRIENREAYKILKEHSCGKTPSEKCRNLYEVYKIEDSKTKHLIDCRGAKYDCIKNFRMGPAHSKGYPKGLEYEKIYGPIIKPSMTGEEEMDCDPEGLTTKPLDTESDSSLLKASITTSKTKTINLTPLKQQKDTRKRNRSLSPTIGVQRSPLEDPSMPVNKSQRPSWTSPQGTLVRSRVRLLERGICPTPNTSPSPSLLDKSWPGRSHTTWIPWKPSPRDPRCQSLSDLRYTDSQANDFYKQTPSLMAERTSSLSQYSNIESIITPRYNP